MELLAQSPITTEPRLQGGINAVANAVKVTLGPKGRNVVLQRESFQALGRWTFGMMTLGWTGWTFGGHFNVGQSFFGGGDQSWRMCP